jgi:hypothetical protein
MGLSSHEATKADAVKVALHGSLIFTLPLGSDVHSLCLTREVNPCAEVMKLLCTCDSPASACREREIQAHLTPLHTNSYLLVTAAKYHLIFKSPSPSHIYPYKPLLVTSYNALFMEMHLFHVNVTCNIQPLQEYYIFIAVIYLIILFQMVNLEILGNMESHFANFTFPSVSVLDFLV